MQSSPHRDPHAAPQSMARGSLGLLARTYFRVRPFLPRSACWAVRRFRIPGIMKAHADDWPIDPAAARRPAGWCGWPQGKSFAMVFTHDVESSRGLQNVKPLAKLEMSYGFRSSFNFIPAGSYADPAATRHWLEENGFEVGVHDLNHDGHLYQSRGGFGRKARRINQYLHDWGAVGFRSGFMLHQLEWLHDLEIIYDSSTFDTDPFEPQPEGTRTIFPFEVPAPPGVNRPPYVELGYTLPQDSTLFILLQEKSPAIWMRKLDWIASHGGMALVNIHPDYVAFGGVSFRFTSYPVRLLGEFMDYILARYDGCFWNPVARDLARWYGQSRAGDGAPVKGGTVLPG